MEEGKGHFEKGAWIEEKEEAPLNSDVEAGKESALMEKRIREVSSLVSTSFSELISLARDLVVTPEGHAHIRGYVEKATSQIEKSLSKILEDEGETGKGDNSQQKEGGFGRD